ncbi:Sugar transporter [Lasiodiplodia theobromae]|uniref:Sugar transporter n=1 Tax=Lasiodiplodia theobromae TaxID=45133 RepID=UPI0015C2E7A5|nr:Sugar transporter [Lasiodiplodia theobromae]KAF4537060.1 Sugar transporter [Lasiodiplodia theobromae]
MAPRILKSNAADKASAMSFRQRMALFTPAVAFVTIYTSAAMFNFGYDVGVFSGLQAMEPFKRRFGKCDADGTCSIPSYLSSIMNSTPYLGKLLGTWVAAPLAERFGRKKSLLFIAICSIIGTVLQIAATTAAQFTVGRITCYFMTGICMLMIPSYLAETAPQELRGLIGGQIQIQIMFSQVVANLINYGTKQLDTNACWMIPLGIQFVMPAILIAAYPFLVESPRWLISRGETEAASAALRKLRTNTDPQTLNEELSVMLYARTNEGKGGWIEVFTGTNRRRAGIAILGMLAQQLSGQIFTSQYGVLFYQQQGYSNSFALGIAYTTLQFFTALTTSLIVDRLGRRPLLLFGGLAQATFLYMVGGLGTVPAPPNQAEKDALVAGLMMFGVFFGLTWAPLSYITMAEAPARRVAEKTAMLANSLSITCAFVISFTVPYLVNADYAGLGAKVGFLYGSTTVVVTVLCWLFVPEMKGRSLEELDALFEKETPTRAFGKAVVRVGGEGGDEGDDLGKPSKVVVEEVERV